MQNVKNPQLEAYEIINKINMRIIELQDRLTWGLITQTDFDRLVQNAKRALLDIR